MRKSVDIVVQFGDWMMYSMTWPKAMRMLPSDDELDGEWKSALEAPCFLHVNATPRSPLWMA